MKTPGFAAFIRSRIRIRRSSLYPRSRDYWDRDRKQQGLASDCMPDFMKQVSMFAGNRLSAALRRYEGSHLGHPGRDLCGCPTEVDGEKTSASNTTAHAQRHSS